MIKLARSWKEMQTILQKTYESLMELFYVFVILFLFMYIFALLGMEMFANRCQFDMDGDLVEDVIAATAAGLDMEPPRENFDDVVMALTTVFIVTLGEDWPVVMYNYTRVYNHSQFVMLYFVICYSIGNFAMLSLFMAVLLSKFEPDDDVEREENEDDDEDEDKPKKPCKNKCNSFFRAVKLEYYNAFATTKIAHDVSSEIEESECVDDEKW